MLRMVATLALVSWLSGCFVAASSEAECKTSATAICMIGQRCTCFELYKRDISSAKDVSFLSAATVICFEADSGTDQTDCLPYSVGTDSRNDEAVSLVAAGDGQGGTAIVLVYGEISETECEARMLTPVYTLPLNDYVGCEVE